MVVITALIGIYFRLRTGGQLFFFKDLAFVGPYVLLLALIEVAFLAVSARRRSAILGLAGIAAAAVIVPASAAAEIDGTYEQASRSVLQLRTWDHELPRGASVRIDVGQSGWELWAMYMFADHPLSALNPLGGFSPTRWCPSRPTTWFYFASSASRATRWRAAVQQRAVQALPAESKYPRTRHLLAPPDRRRLDDHGPGLLTDRFARRLRSTASGCRVTRPGDTTDSVKPVVAGEGSATAGCD